MNIIFKSKTGYLIGLLTPAEAIKRFVGTMLIDDMSDELIIGEVYYVPVLNYLISKESFLKWDKMAEFYKEDIPYEIDRLNFYLKDFVLNDKYYPDATV